MNVTLFNEETIDLSKLTDDDLLALQYEQEKAFANAIRNSKPFSAERAEITHRAYKTIDQFVDYNNSSKKNKSKAYGANQNQAAFLRSIIEEHSKGNKNIVFFEAGVGTGYILNSLKDIEHLTLTGCDVCLSDELKANFSNLIEDTVYSALDRVKNESIDIFYSNDVLEHLPTDEVDALLDKIYMKLAPNGIIITITPTGYSGPHDITKIADPHQRTAQGLHLHEYNYGELMKILRRHGFKGYMAAFRGRNNKIGYVKKCVAIFDWVKRLAELLFCKIKIIRRYFRLDITIVRKEDILRSR